MAGAAGCSFPLVWAVVASVAGCLLPAGHSLGVINTPEKVMRWWVAAGCRERGWLVTEEAEVALWATVVSAFVAGAAVGSALAPGMADRLGRKWSLLVTQLVAGVAAVLFLSCLSLQYVELLILGRIAAGLSAGMATCIGSLYLSEVCPPTMRGMFAAMVPLGITVGMLVAYIAGQPHLLGTEEWWPVLLSLYVVYLGLGMAALFLAPESPNYCYQQLQDEHRARAELMRLRGNEEAVAAEVLLLRVAAKHRSEAGAWTLRQVWQSTELRKLLAFVVLLNIGQQLSGINAVFYYSTLVFRSAGLESDQATMATLCIFIANVVMSISALPFLRYFKRKTLMAVSLSGMLACFVTFVVCLTIVQQQQTTITSPGDGTTPRWQEEQVLVTQPAGGSQLWEKEPQLVTAMSHASDLRLGLLYTSSGFEEIGLPNKIVNSGTDKPLDFYDHSFSTLENIPTKELVRNSNEKINAIHAPENTLETRYSTQSSTELANSLDPKIHMDVTDRGRVITNDRVGVITVVDDMVSRDNAEPIEGGSPPSSEGHVAGVVAMVVLVLVVVLYGLGMGPIPYCYAAETFPNGPRGLAVAVGGAANWGANFTVGLTFPLLEKALHHYSFVLFVFFIIFLLIIIVWKMPEPETLESSIEATVVQSPLQETSRLMPSPVHLPSQYLSDISGGGDVERNTETLATCTP